jgi:regulator of nonsense transcripts 2
MSGNGGGSGGGPNNKPATSSNNRRRRGGNKNKGGGGNAGGRGNGPAPTANNGGRGGGGKPRNRKPKNKSDPNDPPSQTPTQQQQQQQAPSSQQSKKSKRRKAKRNNANQPPTEEQKRLAAQQAALDAERAAEEARRAAEKQRYDSRLNAITTLESTVAGSCATLLALVDTTDQRAVCRESLAEENLNEARKAFVAKKPKLKSDLKKCTAFCKKIKTSVGFDATLVKSLRKDVETLNLTRYIEEICNALVEAKLKVVDVAGVVQVCVALHLRYKDFRDLFLPRLLDLVTGGAEEAKQKRIYFRVLTEMYIVGMLEEVKPVMKIIVEASGAPSGSLSLLDSEPVESGSGGGCGSSGSNGQYNVQDPNIIVSFIKTAGHEIIGITPKSIRHDLNFLRQEIKKTEDLNRQAKDKSTKKVESTEKDVSEEESATVKVESEEEKACAPSVVKVEQELPPLKLSSDLVEKANDTIEKLNDTMQQRAAPKDICSRFRSHLQGTFKSLCASYVSTNKRMVKLEKRCEQDRLLAGSLTEQREKGLLDGRKLLESLRKSVEALAEALNESVPVLEEEDEEIEDSNEGTGLELYKEEERDANLGPFDDEETRAFYCDIPDLLTTIPPALLGYSLEDVERIQAANIEKYGSGFDLVGEGEGEDSTVAMTDEPDPEEASTSPTNVEEDKEALSGKETDDDGKCSDLNQMAFSYCKHAIHLTYLGDRRYQRYSSFQTDESLRRGTARV